MTINELITHLKAAVADLEEVSKFVGNREVKPTFNAHGDLHIELGDPGEQT